MNNTPNVIISSLIVMIGLIIITFMALSRHEQSIRNQAVDECIKISIVDWQSDTSKGYNLVPEWMKLCMQKKGYE